MDDDDEDGQSRVRETLQGFSLHSFVRDRYFRGDSVAFEPPTEMKQAFYNAAAIFFILLLCVMGLYVSEVFKAFIRPLLWAVLCGTFLFPFKKTSNEFMRAKLSHCRAVGLPISLYLTLLPFWLLNDAGDLIVRVFQSHWIMFLFSGLCMPLLGWLSLTTLNVTANIFNFVVTSSQYVLETADSHQTILIWFIIIYFITSISLPFLYKNEVLTASLSALLLPVWMVVATLILVSIQILQLPLFLFIQTVLISVTLLIQVEKWRGDSDSDSNLSLSVFKSNISTASIGETIDRVLSPVHPVSEGRHLEPEPELSGSNIDEGSLPKDLSQASVSTTHSSPEDKKVLSDPLSEKAKLEGWLQVGKFVKTKIEEKEQQQEQGDIPIHKFSLGNIRRDQAVIRSVQNRASRDRLFFLLFWGCFLYKLYNNYWLLSILLLPFPWIGLKKLLSTNTSKLVVRKMTSLPSGVPRLCPDALVRAYCFFLKLDDKIFLWLEYSLDKLVTIFIMCMLCVVTILFTAFTVMQFRQESVQIMTMGSHAWNRTAEYSMSTINQIMNSTVYENQNVSSLINDKLNDWSGQIYFSSRQWLASEIRELISNEDDDVNDEARIKIEEQLIDTFDQMFAAFRALQNSSDSFALTSSLTANASFYDVALSLVNKNSMANVVKLLKSNLSVILNLFRSLGELLVTNFGVLFLMSGKLFSLLLGGGTALLNFFFASIIFFTSLFYLMLYSKNSYIPMQRILSFIPVSSVNGINPAKEVEKALSEAIVSVFDASLRMALFYGVYTWLIHSVFGVSIAFIPAAFAAVAGVVPFVGSYWACLTGVLELWLTCDHSLFAIMFFSLHLLPSYVVDQVIYAEVKGGAHPYLTGLAVAGGVYLNGIEGAIIGPIILCCLLAGTNMYQLVLGRKDDVEETIEN